MHDGFGVREGEHPTGGAMHEYYKAYAERHGVAQLIDFEATVVEISRLQDRPGWNVKIRPSGSAMGADDVSPDRTDPNKPSTTTEVHARKLIVATGVTNRPHRPVLPGSDDFGGPIVHSAELGQKASSVIGEERVQTVAVLGGGKSAYDAVHLLAGQAGRQVEWIIRQSGKGPEWIFPAHTKLGPFKARREWLTTRRIVSLFSPCLWDDGFGALRYLLHFTRLGKFVARKFWANLHVATVAECGMLDDERTKVLEPETRYVRPFSHQFLPSVTPPGQAGCSIQSLPKFSFLSLCVEHFILQILVHETDLVASDSPFWYGTASGVSNFETNIHELIKAGRVRVHRRDISHLSPGTIHFKGDGAVQVDALVTATGFSVKPALRFTPDTTHSDLGVPSTSLTPSQREFWTDLEARADLRIAADFPRLVAGPFLSPSSATRQPYDAGMDREINHTPFRLYRGIAPPGPTSRRDHSLVFVGIFSNIANAPRCELQCLWAYAYLNHRLKSLQPSTTVFEETALMTRYVRHRAPFGHGRFFPDLVFDQNPYFDLLLRDLGLPYWRKPNILAELFSPYRGLDYKGVVQEWLRAADTPGKAASAAARAPETDPLLGDKV
jgi:hypothetical protein